MTTLEDVNDEEDEVFTLCHDISHKHERLYRANPNRDGWHTRNTSQNYCINSITTEYSNAWIRPFRSRKMAAVGEQTIPGDALQHELRLAQIEELRELTRERVLRDQEELEASAAISRVEPYSRDWSNCQYCGPEEYIGRRMPLRMVLLSVGEN